MKKILPLILALQSGHALGESSLSVALEGMDVPLAASVSEDFRSVRISYPEQFKVTAELENFISPYGEKLGNEFCETIAFKASRITPASSGRVLSEVRAARARIKIQPFPFGDTSAFKATIRDIAKSKRIPLEFFDIENALIEPKFKFELQLEDDSITKRVGSLDAIHNLVKSWSATNYLTNYEVNSEIIAGDLLCDLRSGKAKISASIDAKSLDKVTEVELFEPSVVTKIYQELRRSTSPGAAPELAHAFHGYHLGRILAETLQNQGDEVRFKEDFKIFHTAFFEASTGELKKLRISDLRTMFKSKVTVPGEDYKANLSVQFQGEEE